MAKAAVYEFLGNARSLPRGAATSHVHERLREAIITLELRPGTVIDKGAVCRRLGVSRFPVSEALSRLQAEGLVDILPQRGSNVAPIMFSQARENMFLRRTLEAATARSVAVAIDGPTLAALKRNLRSQRAAVRAADRLRFHDLDVEFHDMLQGPLGFPRVRAAVESARLGLDRVRRLLASPRRLAVTLKEHEAILAGLEKGDGEVAARAMERHLDAVMRELVLFAEAQPQLFADRDRWRAGERPA